MQHSHSCQDKPAPGGPAVESKGDAKDAKPDDSKSASPAFAISFDGTSITVELEAYGRKWRGIIDEKAASELPFKLSSLEVTHCARFF